MHPVSAIKMQKKRMSLTKSHGKIYKRVEAFSDNNKYPIFHQ
jgi:hypothetical protein